MVLPDGNGRVGRTLLNYFLMIYGHPPIVIYDEDKREYYAALEQYDREQDFQAMYRFLQKETARTWEKALERERRRKEQEQ